MLNESLAECLDLGNRTAFNKLFRYYFPKLKAYAVVLVEEEVAEDLVQDLFLYLWKNRTKITIGSGFQSYLFQSVYTRCLDYYKRQQSNGRYTSQMQTDAMEECRVLQEEANVSVLVKLYSEDFYKRLYDLLEQVPAQRREVFILIYIKGMKAKEVAELTQIPQRTVESHLYLTIRYLKERMSKKDFYLFFPFM